MGSAPTATRTQIIATCLAAALGAAFGNLAYIAVPRSFGELSAWLQWIVIAPVMFLASRSFLDPLSEGFRRLMGLPPTPAPSSPRGRWLWALGAGSLILIIWLADALQRFAEANTENVILAILTSVFLVGGITLGWIYGARTKWPLAWLFGGLAGLLVNGIATYCVVKYRSPSVDSNELLSASLASGLTVGLAGLAGGLPIDAGRRAAVLAPLLATATFAITGVIGLWFLQSTSLGGILPNIALGLGWLLGLASSPEAQITLSRRGDQL